MVNQIFDSNDRSSGERPRGRAGASQAVHTALDALDAERLRTLFQEAVVQEALKSPGFIFQRMQREINVRQSGERLLKVWTVLDAFSQTILIKDHRLSISAQRCVVELQGKDPASAVFVAHQALDRGLELASQTILATVSKAWSTAETLRDLNSCVSLLECALGVGAFDRTDRHAVGQCDALLATLCDPTPCHRRISSRYKPEATLADISGRMQLGARLAQAVVEAGLVFNESRNIERISMTIRALSTVGMLTSLQARYRSGEIAQQALIVAADEVKLRFQDLYDRDAILDPQHQATAAAMLMSTALTIAHRCFASELTQDGSDQVVRRYALPGAAVATLFQALERGKLHLGNSERESIAVIAFYALELEQGQRGDDVRPATLNSALGLVVKRFEDCPEGAESGETAIRRADCVASILYRALPRITEVSFLKSAIEVLAAAFEANPDGEREYLFWYDAIEKRLGEIQRSQNAKEQTTRASSATQKTTGWFSDALKEASEQG
jgi:hypothetical protein